MVKIELELSEELLAKLQTIIEYSNSRKKLQNEEVEISIENFVISAVLKQINEFEGLVKPLSSNEAKGKLKNKFGIIYKEEGLTLNEIGDKTNLSSSTLSTIFSNKSQPTMDKFILIWSVLNYPPISKCFYWEEE